MNLKGVLKTLKLNEQKISIILGVIILIIAGFFVVKYVKNLNSPEVTKTPSVQNSEETHTVVKGETLWSISQNYYQKGSEWKKIADANNITNPLKLEVGTNLIIPSEPSPAAQGETSSPTPGTTTTPASPEAVSPSPVASPTPVGQITPEAASTNSTISENSYTVVKGDNLWKIAVRAYGDGYKWVEIAHANNLKNPSLIHPGNVFTIPR